LIILDNDTTNKFEKKDKFNEGKFNFKTDKKTEETVCKLSEFSQAIRAYTTESWNQFPNIDLYMDQVITYLERLLNFMGETDGSRSITPSMVNNYVKEGYLKRPVNKKYDRAQLSALYILSMLKPVLPIPLIADSIKGLKTELDCELLFEQYGKLQDRAFDNVADRLDEVLSRESEESFEDILRLFALQLTSEANACQIAAERILTTLNKSQPAAKEKKDKK
jgi:hypothetical protein